MPASLTWPSLADWWERRRAPLARLPRWAAAAVLVATAVACVWSASAVTGFRSEAEMRGRIVAERHVGDNRLYARTVERMRAGEGYYRAAVAEQRAHNYPVRPFVTVREPTLAWLQAGIGLPALRALALALLAANVIAWIAALQAGTRSLERAGAALMLCITGVFAFAARVGWVHEIYAGLLLSLSLAIYRPHRWWPSLLLAGAALAIREIAVPFVLLWALFALDRRRWRELASVAGLLVLFAIGMALHAHAVALQWRPDDPVSQGWLGLSGPALFVGPVAGTTLLTALPDWLAGPATVLPLLGWAGLGGRLGLFATLWFAGHIVLMAVFARPDNYYWNLMIYPAYGAGLALVPRAVRDLIAALRGSEVPA